MLRKLMIASVAAVLGLTAAETTQAFWHHWAPCDPCCPVVVCRPVVTTCYRPVCPPVAPTCGEWYLGWRPGPVRRLLFGPYRWYWVPGECCPVCGLDPCGCEPMVVSEPQPEPTPATDVPSEPAPAAEPSPAPAAEPAPAQPSIPTTPMSPDAPGAMGLPVNPTAYSPQTQENSGILTVYVPVDAKVTINGYETRSTGTRREYVSLGLKQGLEYRYEITAEIVRDGKRLVEKRAVVLTAGEKEGVAFSFEQATSVAGL
ncbi:hypothetical protein JCM19992_15410 [Thermostilla marina]